MTSGQDGSVGTYILSSHTTKRRTTTNFKTKTTRTANELYGSLTPTSTTELKKKHSSRLVGGVQMGTQGGDGKATAGGVGGQGSS